MSEPYIGQIMFTAFNWAPHGYALCDGSTLTVAQNQALYALITTTYGGVVGQNFKLPDLRGRVVVGAGLSSVSGTTYQTGQYGGAETVTLTAAQLPAHTHTVKASTQAGTVAIINNIPAKTAVNTQPGSQATDLYVGAQQLVGLSSLVVSDVGGGGAHQNMQPFQVAGAAIAVTGYFPPRS